MRVAFYTLGCKLNQSESEALASSFKSRGFFIGRHDEEADLFIVNTCTVTSKAEQKARRIIRHLARRNPDAAVIVTGCYAQLNAAELQELSPNVITLGHDRKYQLLDLAECLRKAPAEVWSCIEGFLKEPADTHGIFRFDADTYSFHSRAFLKIQDGCDHQCAYCRVRLSRGASVSLGPDEVITRARHLAASGYRELVLTGVNITAYRDPADRHFRLPQLIRRMTSLPDTFRIRLSSLEPEMISEDLLDAAAHPRICSHFHLPVQSGSDRILKAVHRPYTADKLRAAAAGLRRIKDDPFLAADVIAGLPGESDEDFEASLSLVKELRFAALHVFPFSPRPGTELSRPRHPVPERIAGERAAALRGLADKLHADYLRRWVGRQVEVLPEEPVMIGGEKYWHGLTENYLRVYIPAAEAERAGHEGGVRGSLIPAVIDKLADGRLMGSFRR